MKLLFRTLYAKNYNLIFFVSLYLSFLQGFFNYENFDEKIEKKIHEIKIHNLENIDKDMIFKKNKLKSRSKFLNFSSKELARDLKK